MTNTTESVRKITKTSIDRPLESGACSNPDEETRSLPPIYPSVLVASVAPRSLRGVSWEQLAAGAGSPTQPTWLWHPRRTGPPHRHYAHARPTAPPGCATPFPQHLLAERQLLAYTVSHVRGFSVPDNAPPVRYEHGDHGVA
jgi:hypothetical protein